MTDQDLHPTGATMLDGHPATWVALDGSVHPEQRRPGRIDASPTLVPLLRRQVQLHGQTAPPDPRTPASPRPRTRMRNDLDAAKGVLTGIALGGVCWAALAGLVRVLVRL